MEMSAQNVVEMLGAAANRRAQTGSSSLRDASVAVQPGAGGSRYARMVIALPNGQTFTVQVEEV
jgi:hypothetical protein